MPKAINTCWDCHYRSFTSCSKHRQGIYPSGIGCDSRKQHEVVKIIFFGNRYLDKYGTAKIFFFMLHPTEWSDKELLTYFNMNEQNHGPGKDFVHPLPVLRGKTRVLLRARIGPNI